MIESGRLIRSRLKPSDTLDRSMNLDTIEFIRLASSVST